MTALKPSRRTFGTFRRIYKKIFDKKIRLFILSINHPSLRVKKMQGHENRWEASITMFYRFSFEVHNDYYLFRRIGPQILADDLPMGELNQIYPSHLYLLS